MWHIDVGDVDTLVTGASLLSAGGGGGDAPIRLTAGVLRRVLAEHGPVAVLRPSELPTEASTVPVGICGSGVLFAEKPLAGGELAGAVRAIAEHTDAGVDAVACVAGAGAMLLTAVLAAAQLRLPLVDGDPTGRAFAGIDQTFITLAGAPIAPFALVDGTGSCLIIDALDNRGTERVMRTALPELGGWACYGMRPLSVADLERVMIPGSIRSAYQVGALFEAGDDTALTDRYGVRRLFHGKVVEVKRRPAGASPTGGAASAVLEHADHNGRILRLETQSEYLVAIEDGRILASVPDLIIAVEHDTGECISTERLRYGYWLRVLAMPCPSGWRTTDGLALAGPRAFGYDFDYVPLEELSPADHARGRGRQTSG